jgi:hypothetical protein
MYYSDEKLYCGTEGICKVNVNARETSERNPLLPTAGGDSQGVEPYLVDFR